MIAESQNNYFTGKSQLANIVSANPNWGLRTASRTLKNTAIAVEDWEKLACNRPGWRATIYLSVEEFESNRIKHQKLKRAIRKGNFQPSNIQSGEVPTCSLCGRVCLSRAGLVSHLRKHKDRVSPNYDEKQNKNRKWSYSNTSWQPLWVRYVGIPLDV